MYRLVLVLLSILLLIFSVILLHILWNHNNPPTIRQTANGPVEGLKEISSLGQKYYSFRGIPFAEPPITGTDPYTGEKVDRRFKAPVPLERRWTEPLKVHHFGKICTQFKVDLSSDLSHMGEDCLNLNVYVPAGGSKQKTVLVWIHGGGFNVGDATDNLYGPDFLLSQDNIVVTISYRLGIFGFLNLNFGEYTGNMGLKDQQLALKWIYENIEEFSGNKNEILLFGQSAGGVSVHFQMLNKESRKYFNRAFLASGTAFHSNADHAELIRKYSKFNETDNLIQYLKTGSSAELLNFSYLETPDGLFVWSPVIESNHTEGAFLTKNPEVIYSDPIEAPIIDTMLSFAAQEQTVSKFDGSEPIIKENVVETTRLKLPFRGFTKTAYPNEYKEALEKLKKAYFSNLTNDDAIKRANNHLLSDSLTTRHIVKAAALQAKANYDMGPKYTFLFRFNVTADLDLDLNVNLMNTTGETNSNEANHFGDLCYLFHCHFLDETMKYDKHLQRKDSVYDLIMRSVKMITNFARTGNPSIAGDTPFKPVHSIDEMFCQEVGNELKTSVTNDIQTQTHYDVWQEVDQIYKSIGL